VLLWITRGRKQMSQFYRLQQSIEVQLMATLAKYAPSDTLIRLDESDRVLDIINRLGIPPSLVQMAFIDGQASNLDSPLTGAQRLLLLPAID